MTDNNPSREAEQILAVPFEDKKLVFYANLIQISGSVHKERVCLGEHRPPYSGASDRYVYLSHSAAKQLADHIGK